MISVSRTRGPWDTSWDLGLVFLRVRRTSVSALSTCLSSVYGALHACRHRRVCSPCLAAVVGSRPEHEQKALLVRDVLYENIVIDQPSQWPIGSQRSGSDAAWRACDVCATL